MIELLNDKPLRRRIDSSDEQKEDKKKVFDESHNVCYLLYGTKISKNHDTLI